MELGPGWNIKHKCDNRASYRKRSLTNPYYTLEMAGTEGCVCKAGTSRHFSPLFLPHSDTCNWFDHTSSAVNANVPRTPAGSPCFPAPCS